VGTLVSLARTFQSDGKSTNSVSASWIASSGSATTSFTGNFISFPSKGVIKKCNNNFLLLLFLRLTNEHDVVLRVELWDFDGQSVYADYESFRYFSLYVSHPAGSRMLLQV